MMRRPTRIHLIIDDGHAVAAFAEDGDAENYKLAKCGASATIQPIEFWPAGMWQYSITTGRGDAKPRGPQLPRPVYKAYLGHLRVSRRCAGAELTKVRDKHRQLRYHCSTCEAQIY
jgi:hypothetical protein